MRYLHLAHDKTCGHPVAPGPAGVSGSPPRPDRWAHAAHTAPVDTPGAGGGGHPARLRRRCLPARRIGSRPSSKRVVDALVNCRTAALGGFKASVRPLRGGDDPVRLVPEPSLPQVPDACRRPGGSSVNAQRSARHRLLACRVHLASRAQPRRPGQPRAHLPRCCSGPPPGPCSSSAAIRDGSAPSSASPWCCIPGGRISGQHIHVHCIVTDGGLRADAAALADSRASTDSCSPPPRSRRSSAASISSFLDRRAPLTASFGMQADGGDDDSREFECLRTALRSTRLGGLHQGPVRRCRAGTGLSRALLPQDRLRQPPPRRLRRRARALPVARLRRWQQGQGHGVSTPDEFIRRFLLHVLPRGFTRLRHYGLLANRQRARKLARCRTLLAQPKLELSEPESTEAMMLRLTGIDITVCRQCGHGTLRRVPVLAPHTPALPPVPAGRPP